MYEGIGSFVCVINFLNVPVANVLRRFGNQGKVTEDFSRPFIWGKYSKGKWLFFKPETFHPEKSYLCLVTHSYSDKLVLRWCNILLHEFDAYPVRQTLMTILLGPRTIPAHSKMFVKERKFGWKLEFGVGWINKIPRKRNVY